MTAPLFKSPFAHSELLLKLFSGLVVSNAILVGLVLAAVRSG